MAAERWISGAEAVMASSTALTEPRPFSTDRNPIPALVRKRAERRRFPKVLAHIQLGKMLCSLRF
jgi:hypothetical protein